MHRMLCRLLRSVCLEQGKPRYAFSLPTNSLHQLETMYHDFSEEVQGKAIVDFGCGEGYQSLALAEIGAQRVVGIEAYEPHVVGAREKVKERGLEERVFFATQVEAEHAGGFDIVLSHNSMEHFADPEAILRIFTRLVRPNGKIYITFGPLWYSMYGAHTNFFCLFPWIHLLLPEKVVLTVRNGYTNDQASRYEDVRGGLNRMTRKKFYRLVADAGCKVIYRKEIYMVGMKWLRYIPILRELCIYHLSVILQSEGER